MLSRLEVMVLMGAELPLDAIRSQIASALDIMVHLGRLKDGSRKVLSIVEIGGYKNGKVEQKPLFVYDREEKRLKKTGELKAREKLADAGLTATKKDIVENKKDLAIKEIEAAQIPRSLKDVDIAVVNGNYALEAGLKVNKDALATEDADSIGAKTYGNVVAVKKGNEKTDATKALIKALKSDTVKKYINDKYDGAVVPLF